MKGTVFKTCSLLVLFCFSFLPIELQSQETEATAKLRSTYFSRDYEGGYFRGKEFVKQYPNALELRAWFILNTARNDMAKEAVAAADELVKTNDASAWSWFALAGALNWTGERREEALAASEKALSMEPEHLDFLWMRTETLIRQDNPEEAIAFIDKNSSKVENPAELIATKGNALYLKDFEQALPVFAEARQIDPSNLSAYYIPGTYLTFRRRSDEALPLLKKALALSPNSTAVHQRYWQAILGLKDMGLESKLTKIEADIESFLLKRGDYPGALLAVTNIYRDLKLTEKLKVVENKILEHFNDSRQAEWVLVNRYRDFRDKFDKEGFEDPEKEKQYRRMLRDFIKRPHHQESLLGETYLQLFYIVKDDSTVNAEELLEVVNGMVKFENINPHSTYAKGAIALAERTSYVREAEKIARTGIVEGKKKIEEQRRIYKTEEEYKKSLNWMTGLMYDALGWVFFNEGRLDEAEKELLHSHNLQPESSENLHHIGQLYEKMGDGEKAEEFYIKGLSVQTLGENPCESALENLYKKRHGDLEGFEDYMAQIKEKEREQRKKEILAERISELEHAQPFKLKSLDGWEFSSESLEDKIAVINFWGIWCGPCVMEMPEFQKLHEKYRDDPDVVILTINNDRNPDDVPPWMEKYGYDFAVLLDDGYIMKEAKVTVFPTTWFLDSQGRKVFIKVGYSRELLEEFSWRIEALKEDLARVRK